MAAPARTRHLHPKTLRDNVLAGLGTPLTGRWEQVRLPFAIYAVIAITIAVASPDVFPVSLPPVWKVIVLPFLLVLYPSLIEEVVFRGLLLPQHLRDASPVRRFAAVALSTAVFTAWHPLNHFLINLSDTSIFLEPTFLLIVVALGFACGYSYLRTGSLWAPVLIHWATTVIWNLFFGR